MIKNLAIFSVVLGLCIVGMVFVSGYKDEATASSEKTESGCQKEAHASCPKSANSAPKATCNHKKDSDACPLDCNKECCAAKQKAGTCPINSGETNSPKVCPKNTTTSIE